MCRPPPPGSARASILAERWEVSDVGDWWGRASGLKPVSYQSSDGNSTYPAGASRRTILATQAADDWRKRRKTGVSGARSKQSPTRIATTAVYAYLYAAVPMISFQALPCFENKRLIGPVNNYQPPHLTLYLHDDQPHIYPRRRIPARITQFAVGLLRTAIKVQQILITASPEVL